MKYIIDIPDEILEFMNGKFNFFIEPEVKVGECRHYKVRLDDTEATPYTEPSQKAIDLQHAHDIENVARMNYSKGTEDAWEFAKKVRLEVFTDEEGRLRGYISGFDSYSEAKARYEEWLKRKDEIRVGDEVVYHGDKYVVGYVGADEVYHIVDRNWIRVVVQGYYQIFKTGRHFDEVEELLKKMRGVEADD